MTSLSPPTDATPLKRGSQRQLVCDVVLLYDCHGSIILYASEIHHVTQSALWTTKTPNMTFHTLNIFNRCFQPEACVVKGNGAHNTDEKENRAGMMEDDAGKRDLLRCFPISLNKIDSSDFRHVSAVICRNAT